MEEIINTLNKFIDLEFIANSAINDKDITASEREGINKAPRLYLHSNLRMSFGGNPEDMEDDFFKQFGDPIQPSEYQKRPLFKIEKYQNPKVGANIQRILTDNIIYLCYTGSDEKNKRNSQGYSRVFAIAKTNEGLKIFEEIVYSNGKPIEHEDDFIYEDYLKYRNIQDYGELLEIKKIQAPEEEFSLKEYNSK